jgi:AcrR family transcriptional regulator
MVAEQSSLGSARNRILEAAERVIIDVGAARVTLDLVAQTANVSKGGLLYHFPSKESLLGALAQRYVDSLDFCVRSARAELQADSSRELKALILGVLGSDPRSKAMGSVLLATAANDLALLEVIRVRVAEYTAEIEANSSDFSRAAVVALAVDGLKFRESLRISSFTEAQRAAIVQELLKIADESYR